MFEHFFAQLNAASPVSVVVFSVAVILFGGFLATRLTKPLRLPNVTAYILTGVLLGPCCANVVPASIVAGTEFISDIALAFIAFSSGEFFKLQLLRSNGMKVVVITLFESLVASAFVFALTYWILRLSFPFSAVLAALASATAPASTMMTIRQTRACGDYVDTLLPVVALDDIVSLVAFSLAISVSIAYMGGRVTPRVILMPILLNAVLVGAGILLGFVLRMLVTAKRSTDNRLIVTVALLFGLCGLGAALDVSPLLACMAMGMTYTNLAEDGTLFRQINYFSPPILLIFFVRSGLQFRLDALFDLDKALGGIPLMAIGLLYFAVRIAGKYAGAWLGCLTAHKGHLVRDFLGLALIPQAGVAIGLAALGARTIGGETGQILQTIILSSSILYELVGPASAKLGLYLSHSYGDRDLPEPETAAEEAKPLSLREQILAIQTQVLKRKGTAAAAPSPAPAPAAVAASGATLPVAEEDDTYAIMEYMRRHSKFINRR